MHERKLAVLMDKDRVKRWIASLLLGVLGRRFVARAGRFLSNEAQLDVPNSIETNGELLVQHTTLSHAPADRATVVFDVGANVGSWSAHLLAACDDARLKELDVHAFEPAASTFELLTQTLHDRSTPSRRITLVQKALSSSPGHMTLYKVAEGAETNSLHADGVATQTERVAVTTIDAYCAEQGLEAVDLVKCDAEGHDLSVIQGAKGLLSTGSIGIFQFEYNHRWIHARHFLQDAFGVLEPLGYRLGKVTLRGIELYDGCHPELESFREGNYVALRPDWVARFPLVPWWNSGSR